MRWIVALVVVAVVATTTFFGWHVWRPTRNGSEWEAVEELTVEEFVKEGRNWKLHLESIIDHPIALVWEAMQTPERSAEFIPDTFKKSELKSSSEDRKVVEMHVRVLRLPTQRFTATMTYDDEAKTVSVETHGGPQTLHATYRLESSPDGTKTRFICSGVSKPRIHVPFPASLQKSAMRELFLTLVRALEAGIEKERRAGTNLSLPFAPRVA